VLKATAEVFEDDQGIHVKVVWSGAPLDRPSTGGFIIGKGHLALARRLERAINAQAVHANARVVKDVYGKTYVSANCLVLMRKANADLRRLGY
jgi:hypothetical protein